MISPKGMDLAKPSEQYFPTTPETAGGRLAIKLVRGTEKIGIDLTPEDMKYIVATYGGGPVNFSTGMFNVLSSASKGDVAKPEDRVMMRRFYKITDPERLDSYEGKQSVKALITKVQDADTMGERIKIIQTEIPLLEAKDRKSAISQLKYGGLLPNKQSVIKDRERAQWENNPDGFRSILNKKKPQGTNTSTAQNPFQ